MKISEVEQNAERRPGDGEMHATRALAPSDLAELMRNDSLADQHSLDRQRRLDARFDLPRRCSHRGCIGSRQIDRFVHGPGPKDPLLIQGLTGFVGPDHVPPLAANGSPSLAIDFRHGNSAVTITGACEPTNSSCPSREQMTPG